MCSSDLDVALGPDDTVYVSDRSNARVMAWPVGSTEGSVAAGRWEGSVSTGNAMDQLYNPWMRPRGWWWTCRGCAGG